MNDERIQCSLRVLSGLVSLLEGHGDRINKGEVVSADVLHSLARLFREEHRRLCELLRAPETGGNRPMSGG